MILLLVQIASNIRKRRKSRNKTGIINCSFKGKLSQWRVQTKLENKATDQKIKLESSTKKCDRLQTAVIYSKDKEAQTSEKVENLQMSMKRLFRK